MVKLTLRYLLAYMDDILRPADAREVGRTLSENKAASDLVLRVREVIKRRRLAAPAPLETAPGQNANEMAEFLDNLMSVDEIREFEQLCLDSDELLAEAGACHQILTLVLGGGAPMPESTQQRLRHLASTIPAASAPGPPRPGQASRSLNEAQPPLETLSDLVPPLEYRQARSNWKQWAGVLGIVLMASAWLYSITTDPTFRYTDETSLPRELAKTEHKAEVVPPDAEASSTAEPSDPLVASATPSAGSAPGATTPTPVPSRAIDPPPVELPGLSPGAAPAATVAAGAAQTIPMPPPSTTAPPAGVPVAMVPGAVRPEAATPGEQPRDPALPAPATTLKPDPVCLQPGVVYEATETPLIVNPFGQPQAVMAGPMSELHAGDLLLSPRYSQAEFSLGGDKYRWHMQDLTVLTILGADPQACAGWDILQGRLVFQQLKPTPEGDPLLLRLRIQGQTWLVECPREPTTLAVEVIPQFATQFERMPASGPATASLWVTGAPVRLQGEPGAPGEPAAWQTVTSHYLLIPLAGSPPLPATDVVSDSAAAGQLPAWIPLPASTLTASQKRDQRDFTRAIESSSNLWLDLQGVASNPNPRIAELAAEALALGQRYESLVSVLAHAPHEESRTAAIAGLKYWMLSDPENKALLQEQLSQTFNEQTAFTVYRLLWGYEEQDARDPGISRQLVDWLRHEHVAVRELAIYWISRLTGQRQNYRPLAPVGTREQAVSSWERHLARVGALLEPQN